MVEKESFYIMHGQWKKERIQIRDNTPLKSQLRYKKEPRKDNIVVAKVDSIQPKKDK